MCSKCGLRCIAVSCISAAFVIYLHHSPARELVKLRQERPEFRLPHFPTEEHLQWHSTTPNKPDWEGKCVAFTLKVCAPPGASPGQL